MKEIDVLQYLIQDAKEELEYLEEYKEVYTEGDEEALWKIRSPSKQKIHDDLKMMRRISLGIEKKV